MNRPRLRFFREWVKSPKQVGAFMPSGRALSNLLTADLGSHSRRVIELGPGTGAVTAAILARGVKPQALTLIELNRDFADHLRQRFPAVNVLNAPAAMMAKLVPAKDTNECLVSTIISGLPFVMIPNDEIENILRAAFDLMCPHGALGGQFVLFTYSHKVPVPQAIMARLGLTASRRGIALGNLPPATVYVLSRVQSEASP
jgi:phospholipid N-methyltransferase